MAGVSTSLSIQDKMSNRLNKITAAFEKMNRAAKTADTVTKEVNPGANFDKGASLIDRARKRLEDFIRKQKEAGDGADKVKDAWGGIGNAIKAALAAFSIKKIVGGIQSALDLFNQQYTYEVQLAGVMRNQGNTRDDFNAVRNTASALQGKTTYGDEALIAGAAELSTYLSDPKALEGMMGTLTNYAAGMGGVNVNASQMVEYATQLGKALDGTYDGLAKKGFAVTDAQKKIIDTGTDMERVAVITDIINQSWAGLAEGFANTPEGKIQSFKNKMGDLGELIGGRLMNGVLSLMDAVNNLFSSDAANGVIDGICAGLNLVIQGLTWVIEKVNAVGQFISANWDIIQPILIGIAAAFVIWKVVTLAQAAAQWVLNSALLASPMTWIILAIIAVVAAIAYWVNAVGGLRVAWLIVVNAVLTAWDWVKIGFFTGVYWVLDLFNKMQLGMKTAGTGIANFMGDMKASVLMILQNMVNGAINIINGFINTLNKIPGVNIGLIEQVTFGTTAQLENEAAKQTRNSELEAYRSQIESQIADRNAALDQMKSDARASTAARDAEISAAKAAKAEKATEEAVTDAWDAYGAGGNANIDKVGEVGSVGSIKDDVNIAEEDIKFLRDVAEMRFVQNFVTLTPTVAVDAQITEKVDVDEVVKKIESKLEDEFVAAAEGVYA